MPSDKSITLNASRVLDTVGIAPKQMFHGVYLASVVSNNDPLGQGRVTLYVPQVLGTAVSNWARPSGYGTMAIPNAGQMVHASFAGGDVNHPVYTYVSLSVISSEIAALQATVASLTPGAWTALNLSSNWVAGTGFNPAQVRTINPTMAHLVGLLEYSGGSLTNGQVFATLPAAFVNSSFAQYIGVQVLTGASSDGGTFIVEGVTDTNGLTDGTIGNNSGIVNTGLGFGAGSNSHAHFPGTYAVNNGTHFHTNVGAGQTVIVTENNNTPAILIDSSGNLAIYNASANTTSISFNSMILV